MLQTPVEHKRFWKPVLRSLQTHFYRIGLLKMFFFQKKPFDKKFILSRRGARILPRFLPSTGLLLPCIFRDFSIEFLKKTTDERLFWVVLLPNFSHLVNLVRIAGLTRDRHYL